MWGGPTPHNLVTLSLCCAIRTCSEVPIPSSDRDTTMLGRGDRILLPSVIPAQVQGRHLHNEKYPYDWVSAPRWTPPDALWDHAGDTTHFGHSELKKKDYGSAQTEQFREYLQYQPFLIHTDNNPLTYVMTTPNLDAIGHRWVAAMAGYNFEIEYICGTDNKVADALSRVGERLDEEAVKELLVQGAIKELLNHAVHYGIPRAKAYDPRVVEEHEKTEGEIIIQARMLTETKKNYQNLADSQWVVTQRGD